MQTTKRTRYAVTLVALVAGMSGCGWRKAHLSQDFGKSYDSAFAAQRVKNAAPAPAVSGLDSQEAAIISDKYRIGLAAKIAKSPEEPIIFVAPQTRERPQQLAPSVPKER